MSLGYDTPAARSLHVLYIQPVRHGRDGDGRVELIGATIIERAKLLTDIPRHRTWLGWPAHAFRKVQREFRESASGRARPGFKRWG